MAQEHVSARLEGATVNLKDDVLRCFRVADYKKFAQRTGTVEKVFIPLGAIEETARVRWHRRGNRGKEFIEFHRASDLEIVPANVEVSGG